MPAPQDRLPAVRLWRLMSPSPSPRCSRCAAGRQWQWHPTILPACTVLATVLSPRAACCLQAVSSRSPTPVVVDFRPAATGQLHSTEPLVGIPSDVASTTVAPAPAQAPGHGQGQAQGGPRHYFGIIRANLGPNGQAVLPGMERQPSLVVDVSLSTERSSYTSQRSAGSHAFNLPSFKRAMPSTFTDVRLGPLIGRGAYGRVSHPPS